MRQNCGNQDYAVLARVQTPAAERKIKIEGMKEAKVGKSILA